MLNIAAVDLIIPADKRPNSVFATHSLSACVTALLELDRVPVYWEQFGLEWFNHMDDWLAHTCRLQAIQIDSNIPVRGFSICFFSEGDESVFQINGQSLFRIDAVAFAANAVIYNPAEVNIPNARMTARKLIFVPYDPVPSIAKWLQ